MENELHKQLLLDGIKVTIIEAFVQHIKEVSDIETLHEIKKQLTSEGGVK
ncbi:hypothetical protein [Halobacillus sp. Cin3]|nr:hypothetical protein [Halobacillus sp. Cin3]